MNVNQEHNQSLKSAIYFLILIAASVCVGIVCMRLYPVYMDKVHGISENNSLVGAVFCLAAPIVSSIVFGIYIKKRMNFLFAFLMPIVFGVIGFIVCRLISIVIIVCLAAYGLFWGIGSEIVDDIFDK